MWPLGNGPLTRAPLLKSAPQPVSPTQHRDRQWCALALCASRLGSCGAFLGLCQNTHPRPTWSTNSVTTVANGVLMTMVSCMASVRSIIQAVLRAPAPAPRTDLFVSDQNARASTRAARALSTSPAALCAKLWARSAFTGAKRTDL